MGKYEDESIKKIVEDINSVYFLPDIQREFVWKNNKVEFEEKVYDLFDSLMRGYPIGTMLFWEVTHEDLERDNISVIKFLDNSNKRNDEVSIDCFKDRPIKLVLDGQQRMTIFNLSLRGIFEDEFGKNKTKRKRVLYFNLLSSPDLTKEVNERVFEFKIFSDEGDTIINKEEIWYKVRSVLNKGFNPYKETKEIIEKNKIEKEKEEIIINNLYRLDKTLTDQNVSYFRIDSDKKDEEALEIFVRVNSGGVTLTYSDLLFSKIKQYWKKGEDVVDAREEFENLLDSINNKKFGFDNDFILKTCLVLIDKDIRYQIKNFNKPNVELMKNNWKKIKNSIMVVVDFIKSVNLTSKKYLRSNNAIIPLIYYVYLNFLKEIDNTSKNYDIMKKYIYSVLINGVFGGQSDSLLKDARDIIKENKKDLFPIEEIFKAFAKKNKIVRKGEELRELLGDIRYGSDKSKLILNIIYRNNLPKDFQEDHMFPRSKMKRKFDKSLVDNIANIQALGLINQAKGNKCFEDWLNEPKRSEDYMEIHLVPIMNYKEDNFKEFIEKRRNLIFEKIREFFE